MIIEDILKANLDNYTCTMRHSTLHIPDNLDLNDNEVVMMLASKLYEEGRSSWLCSISSSPTDEKIISFKCR
jgi:hypothetical protein